MVEKDKVANLSPKGCVVRRRQIRLTTALRIAVQFGIRLPAGNQGQVGYRLPYVDKCLTKIPLNTFLKNAFRVFLKPKFQVKKVYSLTNKKTQLR
jgi:hypothetical protein